MFDQFPQLWTTDAVCAIDNDPTTGFPTSHCPLERGCRLLVVTKLCGLSIVIRATLGVKTTRDVVKLRRGKEAIVGKFCTGGFQSCLQGCDKTGPRVPGITSEYNARLCLEIDVEIFYQLAILFPNSLIRRGICQSRCMGLPGRL